jgi:molecular chaperone HtpG
LKLKEDCKEFSDESVVKNILTKHSNFVNFPIKLNGERVNTIGAMWLKSKSDISDEDHESFYKFITHLHEKPMLRLHFHTDSPINIKSLLYVPSEHTEKFGLGNMEPGVSLYCRKVLIQPNMKNLLPNYLRFMKGVVDCEDIPLNLSREHLQDSQLVSRLGSALTRRLLKFFADEAKRSPEDYEKFWNEFGKFIKEGITTEVSDREALAKLIRAETSKLESGKLSSLEDYVSRMKEDQKEIYYVVARARSYAETSPYMEHFKKNDLEVLYLYEPVDDWVMNAIGTFKGKSFKAIESAEISSPEEENVSEEAREQQKDFNNWIRDILSDKVSSVKDTKRLTDSPAVIIDHESMAFRRVMMHMDPSRAPKLPKQALEINATHPLMQHLKQVRHTNPKLASAVVEQIYDNALMAAGLLLESGAMTNRINSLLIETLKQQV